MAFHKSNDNYRAGGVSVFVRQGISASRVEGLHCEACDMVMVELTRGRLKLTVTAIYRSPTLGISDPQVFVLNDLQRITSPMSSSVDCLIAGDINICIRDRNPLAVDYLDRLSH